jgi:hypothetical protein
MRTKRLKKMKNMFYKCVSEFNLATMNGLGGSILSKKSKSLYPNVHYFVL